MNLGNYDIDQAEGYTQVYTLKFSMEYLTSLLKYFSIQPNPRRQVYETDN
jgi:hypothetical protein